MGTVLGSEMRFSLFKFTMLPICLTRLEGVGFRGFKYRYQHFLIIEFLFIMKCLSTSSLAEWSACLVTNQEVEGSISGTSKILKVDDYVWNGVPPAS